MKPVVKQRTEFFNKPIGVTSIRTGEPEMWQSIAASADARYRDAYQYNAERAKQKGEEQAAAVPTKDLFVIDPNTQKPVALEPPRSFGMIGRQAYQNLISRRFEESIQAELESKAQEYAQKYQSSGIFQQEFARHIENMVAPSIDDSGEMSAYGRVINELGAEYLASTTAAMKKREAEIAKAKLKRHNQVERYKNTRKALVMAAEGDTVGAKLLLEEEYHRVSEEFMAGEVPFSEYTKVQDQLDGLESLVSTNSLSKYYIENDDKQPEIILAIQNPLYKNKLAPEIARQIETALLTTTPTNLVSALESFDKSMDEYLDKQIEIARNNYLSNINQNTTIANIDNAIVSVPDNIKPEVRSDLIIEAATQRIHGSISEIGDVGPLADELLNVSFNDTDALVKVLGEEFVAELKELSFEERETIAKGINARSSALNNQRTEEQRFLKNAFDAQILDIAQNKTYSIEGRIEKSNEVIAQIQASNFDNKKSKVDAVRAATAEAVMNQLRFDLFSVSEMKFLQSLILSGDTQVGRLDYQNVTGIYLGIADVPQYFMRAFEGLRYSYGINRTATESKINSAVNGAEKFLQQQNERVLIEKSQAAVSGGYADEADILRLDQEYFKGQPQELSKLINDPRVVDAAQKGVIFPTFAKSIYSNFAGGDSKKSALALQTFAQYKLAEAIVNGQSVQYDLMRKTLDATQYGMMDAALSAVNTMGISPAEFSVRQQTYAQEGGDILADVKRDLGVAQTRNISAAIDGLGMNISPRIKAELQGAIVARKIMGMPVTEETLEQFVNDYAASMNMTEDKFVVAPSIGGMNAYSRYSWMNRKDMTNMREQVITAISDAPEYQKLFTAGTFLDAAVEVFAQVIPGRYAFDMLSKQKDEIDNLNTDSDKIMAMMEVLGVDIYYQPVIEAFENGQPAYRAGFMSADGGINRFIPFEVNNEPVIVSPPSPEESTDALLIRANNARSRILSRTGTDYTRIANPDTRIDLARIDVQIQQLRGQEQTLADFQANPPLFQELTELLEGTGVTLEEIINGN